MRRFLLALALTAAAAAAQTYEQRVATALATVDATDAKGPFHPAWDSLENFQVPEWYQDAKFGIFIHWGVYSVPAFQSEWYPRNMYLPSEPEFKHHVATYGPQSKFGYKDFIPLFRAEHFNAAEWAELFRKAGAKYVVPVAEYHDGFPMYDCSFTDWSAAKMGPHRDVIGELSQAVRKEGLVFGVSSHRAEHWFFFEGGMKFDSDVRDPRYAGLYAPAQPQKAADGKTESVPSKAHMDDWLARTSELVDKYHPQLVYFDWWIEQPVFQPYLQRFAAFYYNRGAEWRKKGAPWGTGVAIDYKNKAFPVGAAVLDIERGKLDKPRATLWQTDTSVGLRSWGYIEVEQFRTAGSLIGDLVDIVSKNGTLLLNIGPKPDGTIPETAQRILLDMGGWLAVNGEAIYGTRPFAVFGEGPTKVLGGSFTDKKAEPFTGRDFRFTTKGKALYAIALDWPGAEAAIQSLGSEGALKGRTIKSVRMLGSDEKLKWNQTAGELRIGSPSQKPCDYAFVYRIDVE
jgi:alpha-L-fucosidase